MQGMSLLLLTAEIQIQKSHLRWLLQNPPPRSISQKKIFFFFSLMVMMLVGLFGCRENQEMEKKILGFLFCAVFAHSVQNLMGFCFWIGRLGCYYFLVHNDENQNILLHDVIVVVGVFSR